VTPTPNATAQWEISQAKQLLTTSPYDIDCPGRTPYRIDCYAMMLLDFWYRHPETTAREQLIERLMDTASYGHYQIQLSWLIDDWLNEQVTQAFQATHGLPGGFEEQWKNRLRLIKTDLDNNGDPDYLLRARYFPRDIDTCSFNGLHWLRRINGQYQITQIEVFRNCGGPGVEVKSTADLNGDGRNDLAYSVIQCGASVCSETLHLRTFKDGGWQDLPFVNGGQTPAYVVIGTGVDGSTVITATEHPPLSASWQPSIIKTILFRWRNGEFLPVDIARAGGGELAEAANLQWAGELVRAQRYTETLQVIQTVIDQHVTLYFDYTPYALFQAGTVQLLSRQPKAALQTWQRVTSEFPAHPVSRDIPYLRPLADDPNGLWRVCAWLRENERDWTPPEPHEDWQIHDLFSVPLARTGYCTLDLLISWQEWTRNKSIAKQAQQFNLTWTPLAEGYDLNGDRIADPIGIMGNKIWAFLSDKNAYHPLAAGSPFPLKSANLVDSYDHFSVFDSNVQIVDLDANHRPEILFSNKRGFSLAEWTGSRFKPHEITYCGQDFACKFKGNLHVVKTREKQNLIEVTITEEQTQRPSLTWRYQFQNGALTPSSSI
jgi:hypothetical protein